MRNKVVALREYNKEQEKVKYMREITLIDTRDIEIIEEADGTYTVEFYYEEDLLIAVKNEIDVEEAIEYLKELALKYLYIKIDILTCAELILVQAQRKGNSIALSFRDTNSGKVHEINFDSVGCTSLADFIDNHEIRVFDILKGLLKVDIVKITF